MFLSFILIIVSIKLLKKIFVLGRTSCVSNIL